ncbi:Sporulation related domain-containing protein [Sphingomonas palmae]|uniref:Sporulation related domain-containing protein n=2 Tax=Sphingomonas palmae TaxID=1855283 RepID=A0A1H7Q6T2_9SPHN|nr:Sporulation related domain-containing protein [Sphingomonas palmae]
MLYSASLLLAGVALPLPLAAQAVVQPLPGTTDADKLADLVRQIGRNPRDVNALVDAGDLSAKLGDATAAASLYKRASQVDPNNARVQAGIARILVNGEHPGEALRYFAQAERAGLSPTTFADDRGLAYDLIGEQERAQRDYRQALARPGQDNEDEVRRRYALSLGISGRKDEALEQIDALLRKSDRGAWRARAFILAMNGDASGANKIATTMMPAGMAGGLAAFFTRLPTLSPADRAFAVHFGEVTPTPERMADARLVPPLPALAPDPYARSSGVQVASRTAVPPRTSTERRRGRESKPPVTIAARTPPRAEQVAAASRTVQPLPVTQSAPASQPSSPAPIAAAPTQVAQALSVTRPGYATSPAGSTSAPVASLAAAAETRTTVPAASAPVAVASSAPATAPVTTASQANAAIRAQVPASAPTQVAANTVAPLAQVSSAPLPAPATNVALSPVTGGERAAAPANNVTAAPVQLASATTTAPVPTQPTVQPVPSTPSRIENEDTILARIVANISIPASELGVAPMPGAAPQPGATTTIDEAAVAAENNPVAVERRRDRVAATSTSTRARRVALVEPTETAAKPDARKEAASTGAAPIRSRRGKVTQEVAEADAVDETPATTRRGARKKDEPKLTPKQAAAKAKADAKALADAKAEAAEKKAARAQPERYWVQVAGGATQGDLHKAWKNVRSKSSLLASRAGYTTPLRATNRVVTGPFKTQEEAQAMVNKLSKDGVSAFTFTSEAGQKMTKLGDK